MEHDSQHVLQDLSHIGYLPVEMWLKIFQYLDSWSLRRCSEVCITFFHLSLRPEFKKFFYSLTMCDIYLDPNCGIGKLFEPEKRTKRNFDKLTLETVNFKSFAFAQNFFMRLGEEITELKLKDMFFHPQMMQTGSKAQDKHFRGHILINFPKLQKLVMDGWRCDVLQYFPSSLKEIYVNGKSFKDIVDTKDKFINEKGAVYLEKLVCSDCYSYDDEYCSENWAVTKTFLHIIDELGYYGLLNSLENNCNIVQHKLIDMAHVTGININIDHNYPFDTLLRFSNLKSITLKLHGENRQFCNYRQQPFPDFSHIKSLKLEFYSACATCVTNIFSSFTSLTKLKLKGNLKESQYRLIFVNMPKLEYLELHGRIPRHIFDSAEHTPNSIEQLKNFQHLLVYDTSNNSSTGFSHESFLKFAYLPNLKKLCLSQKFEVNTINIRGVQHLARQCPNISTFFVTDQINDETIEEIICGWPHLSTLILPNATIGSENTWNMIKDTCRFLQYLCIGRFESHLSFAEQCSLFESISCMKIFKKKNFLFTRTEFQNQGLYLEKFGERHSEVSLKRKQSSDESTSNKKLCLSYNGGHRSTFPDLEDPFWY